MHYWVGTSGSRALLGGDEWLSCTTGWGRVALMHYWVGMSGSHAGKHLLDLHQVGVVGEHDAEIFQAHCEAPVTSQGCWEAHVEHL